MDEGAESGSEGGWSWCFLPDVQMVSNFKVVWESFLRFYALLWVRVVRLQMGWGDSVGSLSATLGGLMMMKLVRWSETHEARFKVVVRLFEDMMTRWDSRWYEDSGVSFLLLSVAEHIYIMHMSSSCLVHNTLTPNLKLVFSTYCTIHLF